MCYGPVFSSQPEFLALLIGLNKFRLIFLTIGGIDLFYLTKNVVVAYSLYIPLCVQVC
jgi:hypothetical protein